MNINEGRLIVRFQRLITEMLVEKRLGKRRSELTDELYQTWREVRQSGLNKTPEYRNVLSRADQHALWLAGLVKLSSPDVAPPLSLKERELTAISLFVNTALPLCAWVHCRADIRQNAHGRANAIYHGPLRASCGDHVADRGDP
jgi:hypothetical protein